MDISKMKEIVLSIVGETAMASPENVDLLKGMEEVLLSSKDKIEELSLALSEKVQQIEILDKSLVDSKAEQDTLTSALADAVSQTENLEACLSVKSEELLSASDSISDIAERLIVSETELASVKMGIVVSKRATVLEDEGVLGPGDVGIAQIDKVQSMSDEEFVSYKEELIALRDELLATASLSPVVPIIEMVNVAPSEKYQDFGKSLAEKMGKAKNKR